LFAIWAGCSAAALQVLPLPHHGHSTTLLADALVLAHQGAIAELDQPLPFRLQHAIRPCTPSRTLLISAPSRATTLPFRQRLLRGLHLLADVAVFARQRLISSSAVWLVFFAMSSSRASAAYSRASSAR